MKKKRIDNTTYQELENQIAELQKQNEILRLQFSIQSDEKKKPAAELKIANISLRQKAEEKYKNEQTLNTGTLSEVDTLKLIHELEVHQVELEMQNEELQLAEEKEKFIADKYTALYNFAPTGYFTLDRNSRICELNFNGAKMIGKERSRLIDNNFKLFITSETLIDYNNFLKKIFADKSKETCEVRFTINNNPTIFVHIEGIISENEQNCFLTVIDITRRKQAEIELIITNKELTFQNQEKEKRAAELIIANKELAFQNHEKEKRAAELRIANIELELQNGKKKKRAAELIIANIELEHQSREKEKRAAELKIANIELEHQSREKEKRAAELIISKIKFAQQNDEKEKLAEELIIANLAVALQSELIVAKEKAEENEIQLKELNATKDKFFSIIAHDLKSPFNHVLGFSDLLIEKIQEKDYEGIEKYAGIIQNSSNRAMDLLMNLMQWSQSQTGRMEFHPVTVEVDELINEITELLANAAQLKSITISTELPNNVNVLADKNMMGTILRNLISNAIKFTHPGGTIVISAEQKQNEWMICVSDNGLGIKKENLDKLFRIEESVSTKGTQQETGTGLGLILCKEFVDKHGGKIWAESQFGNLPAGPLRRNNSEASKAGGSQFYFTVPKNKRT